MIYPIKNIREDFPILKQKVNNYPLIYLDSAASAQRPKYVFEREIQYASEQHSAVHRGIHTLSKNATKYMEDIRSKIAYFLNAKSETEIIFVKGATEGINLVAYSWGHKLYGPPGIGVLYGKKEILDSMPPWEGGGGVTFNSVPWKFEAGSPNISGIIGLGAAIDYINQIGKAHIHIHENQIINYALLKLKSIPKIKIYGSEPFSGLISFNLENHHAYDIGLILNEYGIAIRTGHHCAMPIMKFFKIDNI
ncbi:hypothetical protein GQX74_015746 [Glossina fuscipes]|nr:hypothetical protein GQX74_015746 [Glossina fuscipes]